MHPGPQVSSGADVTIRKPPRSSEKSCCAAASGKNRNVKRHLQSDPCDESRCLLAFRWCFLPAKSTNEMQASTEIRRTDRIVSVVLRFGFCRTLRRSTISRLTGVAYVLLHLPQRRLAGPDAFGARVRSPTRGAPTNPLSARRCLGRL